MSESGHGGARPGAGRKPKDEKFKQPIAKAEKRIADRLPTLIDKMFELADGVLVEEISLTGRAVYQKPPDYKALSYLIDRIMGKPTERQEVDLQGEVSIKGYTRVSPDDWTESEPNEG